MGAQKGRDWIVMSLPWLRWEASFDSTALEEILVHFPQAKKSGHLVQWTYFQWSLSKLKVSSTFWSVQMLHNIGSFSVSQLLEASSVDGKCMASGEISPSGLASVSQLL